MLNLAMLPVVLFWALPRLLFRMSRATSADEAKIPEVTDLAPGQFHMDVVPLSEVSAKPATMVELAALVEADDWDSFLARTREIDSEGGRAEGAPLTYAALRAARPRQIAFLAMHPDCSAIPGRDLPLDDIERLEHVFVHRHRDPQLAALLAKAHLELAWARRGGDYADAVTEDGWRGFQMHLARANEIVSSFDARSEKSPMLAEITFNIALASEWDAAAQEAAFKNCLMLNPRCWQAMSQRAFHLLPRWGGDYEQLERAARQAMSDTHQYGAAAYAAFYLRVLDCDEGAMFSCDPELFAEGLYDMAAAEDGDPVLVNQLIQHSIEIVTPSFALFGGAGEEEINARRAKFDTSSDAVFAAFFCCHVPEAWQGEADEITRLVRMMYANDLEAGRKVHLTQARGIEISEMTA
ncbi:MAG: hypothetical protein AAF922_16635 [Pseudomonadota bacterium]